MSECLDCGKPMHAADASQFFECAECRTKAKKRGEECDIVHGMPKESWRRPARPTNVLGGVAEMNKAGDD